ncbi:hypothetical protein [Georgenia satyanarayanai]|uniref:hypothetical protein n=1 Tax=Georgenia satyanarayanai TaxID=860221 RepID=UPI001264D5F5|nr:hypothetical protein [Georgenia satyanarayanai]
MPRRHLLTAALATTLLLAACGSDDDGADVSPGPAAETRTVDAADPSLPAAPDRFVATTDAGALDLTPVEQGDGTGARSASLEVEVTSASLLPSIPADLYADIASSLHADFAPGDVGADEVRAADGRVFLVATYETRPTGDSGPGTTGVVKLEGHDAAVLFDTDEEDAPRTATVVVSVPVEHTAHDAVIEIQAEGPAQAVSLVDGTLAWGGGSR